MCKFFPMTKFALVGNAYTHQHKYLLMFAFFNRCKTMVDNVANKVDYGQLLKLKTDMLQNLNKHLKEPKVKKMYYLIEAQTKLLDVCELKDFKTITCVKKFGQSQWLCVRACPKQNHVLGKTWSITLPMY